ncbi:hypothetical protein BaRGS_00039007 [Batillaria attramentaria]|uniref:Uncharacterized protein n=1 Tax=Batillaria attramentaria TaxID=370345 RepID=A0ABD0J4F0_9CAEN
MAAAGLRLGNSFIINSFFRRTTSLPAHYLQHVRNSSQQRLTWSQMRRMQAASSNLVFSQIRPKFSRWRLALLLGAGSVSYGFLGFSFGKKDEKEGDPLLRVFREAKEAQIKQDFNVAEIRYHDALKVAEEMLKLRKINQKTYIYAKTNIYDSLADMALGRGELEKAESLYKETMKCCLQQGLAQDDNALIELSIKVASIYAMQDRKAEAEKGLQYCINTQTAKIAADKSLQVEVTAATTKSGAKQQIKDDTGADPEDIDDDLKRQDTHALLGLALETYGRFLMGQRRLAEAVPILERACTTAEQVLGTERGQYLVLLNDLATAHILLKQFDVAIGILNRGISLGTKSNAPELPVLYCNLGAAYLRMSKLDEAEAACNKGRDLATKGHHSLAMKMSQNCLLKIGQVRAKKA